MTMASNGGQPCWLGGFQMLLLEPANLLCQQLAAGSIPETFADMWVQIVPGRTSQCYSLWTWRLELQRESAILRHG